MKLVILESPYAAATPEGVAENVTYARECVRDCLSRDEAPYASHLLYTQEGVLDDKVPVEREKGINAGFAWRKVCLYTVVYVDRGISRGMALGVENARLNGGRVEFRSLKRVVCAQCGGEPAYVGARFCGAACSARWESH